MKPHDDEIVPRLDMSADQQRAIAELKRLVGMSALNGEVVDLEEITELEARAYPIREFESQLLEIQQGSTLAVALRSVLYETIVHIRAVTHHQGDKRRALEKRIAELENSVAALLTKQERGDRLDDPPRPKASAAALGFWAPGSEGIQ